MTGEHGPSDPHTGAIFELARVVTVTAALVAGVPAEQWAASTPCSEWTIRELVAHVVGGNRRFLALLTDQAPPDPGADLLGDDPDAAYRSTGAGLVAAFTRPGVLEQIYPSPIGPASGMRLLQLRITEQLAHGWDLAQATRQRASYPEDIAEKQLAGARARLGDELRGPGAPFGLAQPVADDAPALDRLAAYFGRSVPWLPPNQGNRP